MKRLAWLGLLTVLTAFVPMAQVRADETLQPAQVYAVVIGVGDYNDRQIIERPTADSDAKAFYDVFTDKNVGGIPPDHVQLLLSAKDEKLGAKAATKANILAAFKTAAQKAGADDRLVVVWVGDGASVGERTCFFAADSSFRDRARDALTAIELEAVFKTVKAKEVVAFLDLDLKGFKAAKDPVLEPNIMDFVRVFLGVKEKDDAEPPAGRVVVLAGSGTNPVVTVDGKEGIFTAAIVKGLRGAADKDGYEADGNVTVDELSKYIENEVPELSRKYGKNEEAKQQLPIVIAKSSRFVISKNPQVAATVAARLKKLEALEKQEKISKEVADEGKRLLSRMPPLRALQDLRKNYQALTEGTMTEKEFVEAREKLLASMTLDEDSANSYAKKLMYVFDRYKQRYIKELNAGDMVVQAVKGLYNRADQKIPADIQDRLGKAKDLSKSDLLALLKDARMPLGKREDFDQDRDVEVSIQAGISKLVDPYTDYTDRDKVAERDKDLQGFFTGIGVLIRRDLVKDALLVISPIKGSPAYKAGLKAGDYIVKIRREVDNEGAKLDKPDEISTKGLKVQDAVKLIVGKPGTPVKVTVERPGEDEPKEYEIKRGLVEVENVLGYKRKDDDSWNYFIDPKNKIAYIHLSQFSRNSFMELEKAIQKIEKEGVRGLVLDLRFNPGGYLDIACDICDLFIDDGLIVTIKPRVGSEQSYVGRKESIHAEQGKEPYEFGSHTEFPMVCLINGGSASASEILAACLQDHERAFIMGERSFGKGSVQTVQPLRDSGQRIDLGEMKMTTATYWRPNGKNINKSSTKGTDDEDWGVRPNKGGLIKLSPQETVQLADRLREWSNIPNREAKVKDPEKEKDKDFKDRQLEGALEYLRGQLKLAGNKATKKVS